MRYYWLKYKDFAGDILAMSPNAALYDETDAGEKKLVLTGTRPANFTAEEIMLCDEGFNEFEDPESTGLTPAELTQRVDYLRSLAPNPDMAKVSRAQGQWLHKNHPAFMPKVVAEI